MVGRLLSFWESLFLGAMLVLGRVGDVTSTLKTDSIQISHSSHSSQRDGVFLEVKMISVFLQVGE